MPKPKRKPIPRTALKQARQAVGLSQEQLSEKIAVGLTSVARWEQNRLLPRPHNRRLLAKALRISEEKLNVMVGLNPDGTEPTSDADDVAGRARSVVEERPWPDGHADGRADVVDPSWELTDARYVLHLSTGGAMDRRNFLTISGGTLAGVTSQWGHSLDEVSLPTPPKHLRLDHPNPVELDYFDARLAGYSRLDDAIGGRTLCPTVTADLRQLTHLADQTVYDTATGKRLFETITKMARMAGYVHFDASLHAAAQNFYITALRASVFTKNPINGAHVLSFMSQQAADTGHPQEAINLIEVAEEHTKRIATPRLRSWLAAGKARAYAAAGDTRASAHAINDAENWLNKANPGTEEPDWLYLFDENYLRGLAAQCWTLLGQPRPARPIFDRYLRDRNPQYVRDGAVRLVRSAQVHLQLNDLEPACADLHTAIDLASETNSTRVADLIRTTRDSMSRYPKDPHIKKLNRHIIEALTD